MHQAYVTVLLACTAAAVVLVGWRLASLRAGKGRPSWGRLANEWIWTLVPLAVLAGLLWQALK
ncbi:MAG: hypothetical protein ACRD1L_07675 [Terriglobales bacterium]